MVISAIGRLVPFSANPESAGKVNVTRFHAFALPSAGRLCERTVNSHASHCTREKIANFLKIALSTPPKLK